MSREQHAQQVLVAIYAATRGLQAVCAAVILMLVGVEPRLTMGFVFAALCLAPATRTVDASNALAVQEGLTGRFLEISTAAGTVLVTYIVSRLWV